MTDEEHIDRLPHLPGDVLAAGRVIRRAGYAIVQRDAYAELQAKVDRTVEQASDHIGDTLRRLEEAEADRDRARDAAVALEQENARLTEESARLLSAAAAAYGLPPAEVLATVREELASERGETR